jgi:murein DD-endopeptidase
MNNNEQGKRNSEEWREMMIKWEKIFENERRQFEGMTEAEKFVYFLLLQYGSPYGWGKENPEASDCSGAVCMALYAATGLLMRTTADDLYRRVFTKTDPRSGDIRAVFYLTTRDKQHGDRPVSAGTVVHVAGIVEDGIILNSQEPYAKVRRMSEVTDYFKRTGHEIAIRGLDRAALERSKNTAGLDPEWRNYFE